LVTLKTKLALLKLSSQPKVQLQKRVALAFAKVPGGAGGPEQAESDSCGAKTPTNVSDDVPLKQGTKTTE
jgi:hypothetical protein